ncbi:hypothetical protein LK996_01020 [Lysobacter sp. A6]|uniref:Calx-beta domain-containing protein n=1 Tax=Noviluteimonas lactosilytica TaxID=2888523 RepID=A0ABS8JDH7_9GAMM|nr:Calx-beta domain-containing protein [Lysobacter lactosilyticus]MCC8361666.1 hypothetical protein [Lysobacter lactosilyticus]
MARVVPRLSFVLVALCLAGAAHAQSCPATLPAQGAPIAAPLPVFPADNWWNTDISTAPVDALSPAYIAWIDPARQVHPDFGAGQGANAVYGFPYAVVNGAQPKWPVTFEYWDESDGVNLSTGQGVPFYPLPQNVLTSVGWVEGGPPATVDLRGSNDRHILIVDCTNRTLYELYNVWFSSQQNRWYAGSGAFFDMKTNNRRPEGWTSADASGLAIFPGLVRFDEAANAGVAEIQHAFRVTMRNTNGHVYPASHTAGSTSGALPMGARLRLKKNVNGVDPVTRTNDPAARKIFRAMQKYGLIVADNGSDMYISGTYDVRWNNDVLNPAFHSLRASDFEVVQLGWKPSAVPTMTIADVAVAEGQSGTKAMTFTVRLSAASAQTVTASYATSNVTAVAGSDYVSAIGSVSFAPGQTSRTISVTVKGDRTRESAETFRVTLTNPVNTTLADGVAAGTITNDDLIRTGGTGQKTVRAPAAVRFEK